MNFAYSATETYFLSPKDYTTSIEMSYEVDEEDGRLYMANHLNSEMGHRIADVNACAENMTSAVNQIENEMQKLRCLGSYYRLDLKELSEKYTSQMSSIN